MARQLLPAFLLLQPLLVSAQRLASGDFHPLLSAPPQNSPGVRLRLQSRGVKYLNQVAANILAEQLPKIVLPDVEHLLPGDQGYIMIRRLRLSRFRRAVVHNITTLPPNRISWTMRDLDIGFIGDLSGRVNIVVPFNLTGQAEVIAHDLTFQLDSAVEKNKNGSAHVSSISCMTLIREVHVTNHNGGLFGLAVTVFKQGVSENVRNLLQTLVCKKIRKYIDEDLNEKLSEVQTKSPLSEAIEANSLRMVKIKTGGDEHLEIASLFANNLAKHFFIDFRLREPPICGYDQVELASSGEISFQGQGGTPFGPSLMVWSDKPYMMSKSSSMLELLISDYLPNSFFYQAYKQRLIHLHLSQSSPPEIARFLRTNCDSSFCIADLIPQLSDQFPNSSFEMTVSATRAPAVLFSEKNGGVISLNIGGVIAMYTMQSSQKKQIAVLDVDVVADAKLTLQEQNVSGSVELTKFELTRRVGHIVISEEELADISLLIARVLENMINDMLISGIPLPVPHVLQLHDVEVTVLNRRLSVKTDIEVDERKLSKIAARTIFNGPTFYGSHQDSPNMYRDGKIYQIDGSFVRDRLDRTPTEVEPIMHAPTAVPIRPFTVVRSNNLRQQLRNWSTDLRVNI